MIASWLEAIERVLLRRQKIIGFGIMLSLAAAISLLLLAGPGESALEITPGLAIELTVKFAVVLGLIYATGWGLRRLWMSGYWPSKQEHPLQLLDTLPLSQQRAIHVIRAGDQTLVIGATPGQITLLGKFSSTEIKRYWPEATDLPASFEAALRDAVRPPYPEQP